jgi:hypothetical protein
MRTSIVLSMFATITRIQVTTVASIYTYCELSIASKHTSQCKVLALACNEETIENTALTVREVCWTAPVH